jgi:Caspase domain
MNLRALIIALEKYPKSRGDVAAEVTGAANAGQNFAEWIIRSKMGGQIRPGTILVCSDGGSYDPAVLRFGVEREQILDAIEALIAAGRDQTEELYVFYSGHGFMFQDATDKRAIAILVAADFVSTAASGGKCLDLSELQRKLWGILGGKNHYYFVDACRNLLNSSDIEPVGFGRIWGPSAQRGKPTRYTLYSTKFGETAEIQSPFASALVDGLEGKGRAKGYTPNRELWVKFPLLKSYVQSRMGSQQIGEEKDGDLDGLILQIQPVPTYKCKVTVLGAASTDLFKLRRSPAGQPEFLKEDPFFGSQYEMSYQPGDLVIDVLEGNNLLERIDPPPNQTLDFYDECNATFLRPSQPLGRITPVAANLAVDVTAPNEREIRALNLGTGKEVQIPPGQAAQLNPGTWELAVMERGSVISKEIHTLVAGEPLRVELPPSGKDPVRKSIVDALSENDPAAPLVDFSETLGDTANRDLGLWLTLIAGARIVAPPGEFHKLGGFPLPDFSRLTPGQSSTYIISALPRFPNLRAFQAGASKTLETIPILDGVCHAELPGSSGLSLLAFELGNLEKRTITSWNLPNRITLVVLSEDEQRRLNISQFMLPVYSLRDVLPQKVREYLGIWPSLRVIRTMYEFQRLFARGRILAPPDFEEKIRWNDLLNAKWIDPITSLIVCYDVIRRGDEQPRADIRDPVLINLQTYFPGIPDVSAIAEQLNPGSVRRPAEPPLFTEGLLAFPGWAEGLSLPADRLDYGALWTTWKGVLITSSAATAKA